MATEITPRPLTAKQEAFCQAYVETGSGSEAFKMAYNAENCLPNTIANKAISLRYEPRIAARISELRNMVARNNQATLDELLVNLTEMVRFDPGEIFDETGAMLPIKKMPKAARQMITSLDSEDLFFGRGKDREIYGQLKKVKFLNKLDAIEKLLKHLGAYDMHNRQKAPVINQVVMFQLPQNGR